MGWRGGQIPSYGALGYGDVVLPGMLVLFMREFDLRRRDRLGEVPDRLGYFAWAMMAYVAGTKSGGARAQARGDLI